MIEIDGSYGEGGGQIIRSTLSLAAILGQPVRIKNIRAGRKNPGLMPQHVMAAKAVAQVCDAQLENAFLNSRDLIFFPGVIKSGKYRFDVGTAGSAVMVAQAIIPVLLFGKELSTIEITGGTHVPQSPSFDYLEKVFNNAIKGFGAEVHMSLLQPGYFPRGGGHVNLKIFPSHLKNCTSWRQEKEISGIIRISNLAHHIADREKAVLEDAGVSSICIIDEPSYSPGNSLTIWRGLCGSCALGEKKVLAEEVAQKALILLASEIHDVDRYLADQLLIYAALAQGVTLFRTSMISNHLKTNAFIVESLTKRKVEITSNIIRII